MMPGMGSQLFAQPGKAKTPSHVVFTTSARRAPALATEKLALRQFRQGDVDHDPMMPGMGSQLFAQPGKTKHPSSVFFFSLRVLAHPCA